MPQLTASKNKRAFYKQTFEVRLKGKTRYMHTLLVNPQEMSVEEPARANVQQTMGGAYVSNFGQGLHNISLSGTTGYGARYNADGALTDGYTEIQNFRKKVYRDFIRTKETQMEMFWYNWEDGEYYKVFPTSFRLMRNQSEPTLYRYEIRMTALAPVGAGKKPKLNQNALDRLNLERLSNGTATALSAASEALSKMRGGSLL